MNPLYWIPQWEGCIWLHFYCRVSFLFIHLRFGWGVWAMCRRPTVSSLTFSFHPAFISLQLPLFVSLNYFEMLGEVAVCMCVLDCLVLRLVSMLSCFRFGETDFLSQILSGVTTNLSKLSTIFFFFRLQNVGSWLKHKRNNYKRACCFLIIIRKLGAGELPASLVELLLLAPGLLRS